MRLTWLNFLITSLCLVLVGRLWPVTLADDTNQEIDQIEEDQDENSNGEDQEAQLDEDLDQKKEEIEQLKDKLQEVQGQKQTLASTINYLDNKIQLTQAQIAETQAQLRLLHRQIIDLTGKISILDASLDEVSQLLVNRVNQTYKRSRIHPIFAVLASHDMSSMLKRYKYLQMVQENDREVLYQMEATRADFDNQKALKEAKQEELDTLNAQLENQQTSLAQQQQDKQALLEITRNDEKRFQSELAQKLAELEAIQSIIAGKGDETEVGGVDQGEVIAQVIPGASTCSSGAHLHFEVARDSTHRNPANYLENKSVVWDNGPDAPFPFTGDWDWPLNSPVRITQGYGMTFYAATMRYYNGAPHTGIDMVNNRDYSVKAVKDGTLFRGAIACGGGTLRYVRVEHDQDLSTYYLHVNY